MMETTTNTLFYDKCRLCLQEVGVTFCNSDLAQDILLLTGVTIKQSDNLPQKVCAKCLDVIAKAKDLRQLAKSNDELLCCLFDGKEEDMEVDTKDEAHKVTETLARDKMIERKGHGHQEIKRSTSTSSNQSVERHKKKLEISVRKDLYEKTKEVKSSTKVEVKNEEKPRHKMIKNSDGRDEYICGVCNKHYKTWKKLYLHNRLHNKKIICPLDACGKKFATKGDLEKHLRTHTGVKPYICDICDKGFTQQGTLKVHKETVHNCFTFTT